MERKNTKLVAKLEEMLARSAAAKRATMEPRALEQMSLGQLFYYALVASGDDRGMVLDGAMLGA